MDGIAWEFLPGTYPFTGIEQGMLNQIVSNLIKFLVSRYIHKFKVYSLSAKNEIKPKVCNYIWKIYDNLVYL